MQLPWWFPLGRVPEIDARSLAQWLRETTDLQIVDVRTRLEYDQGHITGALSAPIQSFPQALSALDLDPDRSVVLICRTAHRSIPATRLLNRQGFDARQLAQGMNAWWREKLPTTKA